MSIEWDGKGLPPLGCICEIAPPIHDAGTKVRVLCHDENAAVCRILEGDQLHSLCQLEAAEIRPVRTEAERKRDDRIASLDNFISGFMKSTGGDYAQLGEAIYEWLAVLDRLK